MGMYKNWLLDIEGLIWEAIEAGFTDDDGIYAFVFMRDARVSRDTVAEMLKKIRKEMEA